MARSPTQPPHRALPPTAELYDVWEQAVTKPGYPRTVLRFAPVDGRQTLVNVEIGVDIGLRLHQEGEHIEEPAPLAASATRLPLRQWALELLQQRAEGEERSSRGKGPLKSPGAVERARKRAPAARADAEAFKRLPGRPRTPRCELEKAAVIYVEAYAEGLPPTKTVAERCNLSRSAAAKRIARARQAGLLGETEPRKAGGVETEEER
jgi:hypothetical protein